MQQNSRAESMHVTPPPRVQVYGRYYWVKGVQHLRGFVELEEIENTSPEVSARQVTPEAQVNEGDWAARRKLAKQRSGMAEPRVRLTRHHGQLNFGNDLSQLLYALGDPKPHSTYPQQPLPETLRVLDEIVTDFVIETCHEAAQGASYSGRQKVKVDDFRFALRRDPVKLGRVQELFHIERELKEARKVFDQNDDKIATADKKNLEELSMMGAESSAAGMGKKGKGKGAAKAGSTTGKRASDAMSEGSVSKRRKI